MFRNSVPYQAKVFFGNFKIVMLIVFYLRRVAFCALPKTVLVDSGPDNPFGKSKEHPHQTIILKGYFPHYSRLAPSEHLQLTSSSRCKTSGRRWKSVLLRRF